MTTKFNKQLQIDERVSMNDGHDNEHSVQLVSANDTLYGTVTRPELDESSEHTNLLSIAALLLLADSGPLDRNQNSIQVQLNIFNDIANYLDWLHVGNQDN